MLHAGKLRHRITIQAQQPVTDSAGSTQNDLGEIIYEWVNVDIVYAAIEPISGREFMAAQVEQSKIQARITVRYRSDLTSEMRLLHAAKGQIYNIEAILADPVYGIEYLTLPCSLGVRYDQDDQPVEDSFLLQDDYTSLLLQDDDSSVLIKG